MAAAPSLVPGIEELAEEIHGTRQLLAECRCAKKGAAASAVATRLAKPMP